MDIGIYGVSKVAPRIKELERSHPSLALNGPHLEYPWETSAEVVGPAAAPVVEWFDDPANLAEVAKIYRVARVLLDEFDRLFG